MVLPTVNEAGTRLVNFGDYCFGLSKSTFCDESETSGSDWKAEYCWKDIVGENSELMEEKKEEYRCNVVDSSSDRLCHKTADMS